MSRRARVLLTAAIAAVIALPIALALLQEGASNEEFCAAYGVFALSEPVQVGDYRLYINEPASRRDPCLGDDLWHYSEDLTEVDGVMFDDCVISWVDGGRTNAVDANIPCPATP